MSKSSARPDATTGFGVYLREGGGFLACNLADLPACTLKKMQTDDGLFRYIAGKAFVGKQYLYSPKSRAVCELHNVPSDRDFSCEVVWVWDDSDRAFHIMPTECLSFP